MLVPVSLPGTGCTWVMGCARTWELPAEPSIDVITTLTPLGMERQLAPGLLPTYVPFSCKDKGLEAADNSWPKLLSVTRGPTLSSYTSFHSLIQHRYQ